ncbi:MAG TPA: flagellar assembly protein FliH [Rhodanobacteraceae bacterium]|nr:flagellar assembly protein FliH [Rhodanobacteraceae bacterium]
MSDGASDSTKSWQPWRMGELAEAAIAEAAHAGRNPVDERAFQQQSELRALREKTRAAAHQEGYTTGFAEGREEGYAEGLQASREAGERELAERRRELVEPLVALVNGLREALEQLDTDIGDSLADVALATGRQLAGDALQAKPEQIRTLIRDLLREEPLFSGQPCLRLHPDDLALVDSQLADELGATGWKVQADATLERGGCRVTGPEGELNATREVRWQALLARARRYGSAPIRDAKPRRARKRAS